MGYAILANDQYFTLLPGECRRVEMTVRIRTGIFFEKLLKAPNFALKAINVR
jgi:hypothetical protein